VNRSGVLLGLLAVVLVTVLWWLFLIAPKNATISDTEQQITAAEQEMSSLQTRIAQLNDIKDQEISYLFAIGAMESSIPEDPGLDALLEDLTFLAEGTGVDLISVSASPPEANVTEEGPRFFEMAVNVAIEGQFFEILGFLYGIEDLERLIVVDGISLNPLAAVDDEDPAPGTDEDLDGETDEGRLRPDILELGAELSLRGFTRSPAGILPGQDGAPDDGGEAPAGGAEGEDTTTTTVPSDEVIE